MGLTLTCKTLLSDYPSSLIKNLTNSLGVQMHLKLISIKHNIQMFFQKSSFLMCFDFSFSGNRLLMHLNVMRSLLMNLNMATFASMIIVHRNMPDAKPNLLQIPILPSLLTSIKLISCARFVNSSVFARYVVPSVTPMTVPT